MQAQGNALVDHAERLVRRMENGIYQELQASIHEAIEANPDLAPAELSDRIAEQMVWEGFC